MSIKSDVLEHLMTHPNEVVSLTALASKLDVTLEQIRGAVSSLRTGARGGGTSADEKVSMKDQIRVVSRGYAVKYCPIDSAPPATPATPSPADVPKKRALSVVDAGSDARPATVETAMTNNTPDVVPIGVDHPYSDDVEVVLAQLGPVAHKVFSFVASQNGQNVTGDEVVESTGLKRSAVSSAFYNTLFNPKQLNRNARRLFVKVGKDVYRMSLPGDGVIIGPSVKHSQFPAELPAVPTVTINGPLTEPVVTQTFEKPYGDRTSTQKRIFEELRTLPDGSVLIEDENGNVYKAREI